VISRLDSVIPAGEQVAPDEPEIEAAGDDLAEAQ
jgi:hypothetical protein